MGSRRRTLEPATPARWAAEFEPISFDALRTRLDEETDVPERSSVALAAVCMVFVPVPSPVLTAWRTLERSARALFTCVSQLVAASKTGAYTFKAPLGYEIHPDLLALHQAVHGDINRRVLARESHWLQVANSVVQHATHARLAVPVVETEPSHTTTVEIAGADGVVNRSVSPTPLNVMAPLRDWKKKDRPWFDLLVEELVKVLAHHGVPMPAARARDKRGSSPVAGMDAFDHVEEILTIVLRSRARAGFGYDAIRLAHVRGQRRAANLLGELAPYLEQPTAQRRLLGPNEWELFALQFAGSHGTSIPIVSRAEPIAGSPNDENASDAKDGRATPSGGSVDQRPAGCIWVPRRASTRA